jgi:hypothetical protein
MSVNQHGASHVLQCADTSLSHTVLMVRADSSKRKRLSGLFACGLPRECLENPIVGVIVLDADAVTSRESFEGSFTVNRLVSRRTLL